MVELAITDHETHASSFEGSVSTYCDLAVFDVTMADPVEGPTCFICLEGLKQDIADELDEYPE